MHDIGSIIISEMHKNIFSGHSVRIEEVTDDELLQLFASHFPVSVLVDDLHIRSDVSGCWLETFVHGAIAVHQPLRHFDGLADSVSVPVVGLDDLPECGGCYLARLRHSSLVKSPPFSTPVKLV